MSFISQRWGVYSPPVPNEQRVIAALLRHFPGATWETEPVHVGVGLFQPPNAPSVPSPASASGGSAGAVLRHRLAMLSVLDQALAFGATEPAGKTHLESPTEVYDYAVIGSSKMDAPALEKWLKTVPLKASIIMTEPRYRKDGFPLNSEAILANLRPSYSPPLRKDLFGEKAREAQVEQVCNAGKTIVLVGKGSRVTTAKNWAKRFDRRVNERTTVRGHLSPHIIEI